MYNSTLKIGQYIAENAFKKMHDDPFYEELIYEVEEDTKQFIKIYTLGEKDIEQNNIFSI